MTHRLLIFSSLTLLGACAGPDFESGEAAVCLGSDSPTPIPVTAKANWEVTGMVTAIRDFDASDSATMSCSSPVATAVDVLDSTGTTWTLGYGIVDAKGDQTLPDLDLDLDTTVNLIVRQSTDGLSRGFVIHDGLGVVAAMDEGVNGGALDPADVDGLSVTRGTAIGFSKDDCGKMEGTQITFDGESTVSSSPFGSTTVDLDGVALQVYAIDAYYWTRSTCDDEIDHLTWAVFR
jgi:hypothetical protein